MICPDPLKWPSESWKDAQDVEAILRFAKFWSFVATALVVAALPNDTDTDPTCKQEDGATELLQIASGDGKLPREVVICRPYHGPEVCSMLEMKDTNGATGAQGWPILQPSQPNGPLEDPLALTPEQANLKAAQMEWSLLQIREDIEACLVGKKKSYYQTQRFPRNTWGWPRRHW
ncbi:unnamed protein product [Symbiodinium sp. CCMP2592]|nr:unnamed protein product [Symbiodinium sp. CCMP2592]